MSNIVNEWKIRNGNMDKEQIVRLQVLIHCYLGSIELTKDEVKTLTYIGLQQPIALNILCRELVQKEIYISETSARNAVGRLEAKEIIEKEGKNKKMVSLSKNMNVQCTGNVLVDVKCLYREPVI